MVRSPRQSAGVRSFEAVRIKRNGRSEPGRVCGRFPPGECCEAVRGAPQRQSYGTRRGSSVSQIQTNPKRTAAEMVRGGSASGSGTPDRCTLRKCRGRSEFGASELSPSRSIDRRPSRRWLSCRGTVNLSAVEVTDAALCPKVAQSDRRHRGDSLVVASHPRQTDRGGDGNNDHHRGLHSLGGIRQRSGTDSIPGQPYQLVDALRDRRARLPGRTATHPGTRTERSRDIGPRTVTANRRVPGRTLTVASRLGPSGAAILLGITR